MPRIPTPANQGAQRIGSQQVTADPQTPGQRFSVPSFEGPTQALFETASRGLEDVAAFANDIQEQEDERNLLEIQNEFSDRKRELMFGENGLVRRKGKNAIGITDEARTQVAELEQQLLSGRSMTPEARQSAQAWLSRQRDSLLTTTSRQELTEREQYQTEQINASIENSIEEGAAFYNNPQKVLGAEQRIRDQASEAARRRGMSEEAAQEFVQGNVSALHAETINRALANREYGKAKAMLDTAREDGKIEGDQLAQLEKSVNAGIVEEEGFDLAEAALAANGPDNLDGMLRYARENAPNAQVREYAVSEVKTRFNEQQNIRQNQRRIAYERLAQQADDGQKIGEAEMEQADLTVTQKDALRKRSANRRQQLANPGWSRPTEPSTKADYVQFKAQGDMAFANIEYDEFEARFRDGLSEQAWSAAQAEWAAVNSEFNNARYQDAQSRLDETIIIDVKDKQQLENTARLNGLDPDDPDEYGQFYNAYKRRLDNWARANNRTEVPGDVRADIQQQLVNEAFVYQSSNFTGARRFPEVMSFEIDEDTVTQFGETHGYSEQEIQRARREFPQVIDTLSFAGQPTTGPNVDKLLQIAPKVSPGNHSLFYENYPLIVASLEAQNKPITDKNIQIMWQNHRDKFR